MFKTCTIVTAMTSYIADFTCIHFGNIYIYTEPPFYRTYSTTSWLKIDTAFLFYVGRVPKFFCTTCSQVSAHIICGPVSTASLNYIYRCEQCSGVSRTQFFFSLDLSTHRIHCFLKAVTIFKSYGFPLQAAGTTRQYNCAYTDTQIFRPCPPKCHYSKLLERSAQLFRVFIVCFVSNCCR